jgi:hypothetical protein
MGVGNSLREIRATGLRTLLNTQVGTLEQWVAERRHEAEQLAADDELGPRCKRLALGRGGDPGRISRVVLDRAASSASLRLLIAPRWPHSGRQRVRTHRRRVSADFLAHMASALRGKSVFVRPYVDRQRRSTPGRAWMAAPVRLSRDKVVAVLALGSPVDKGFASLFSAARLGQSGEALAFDAEGWLLSPSRMRRNSNSAAWRPAWCCRPASRPRAGTAGRRRQCQGRRRPVAGPYESYLGREVIGAWRWLRDIDIGVAVEIEAGEAYAPLFYLQVGFVIVLLLLFAVWLAGFLAPGTLATMLRREGQRQMGPYKLLRQIGEGAISNVYLAQHRMLKRPAAVKVLKQQATSEEWTARFQREVQLSSNLHHPNTIAIYDYGTGSGGEFWYAMEYLEGLSLADLVERYGPVPPPRTATSCARPAPRCGRRIPAAWCIATSSRRTSCSATSAASATSSRCWTSAWSSRSAARTRAT